VARITDAILAETYYNTSQIRIIEVKKPVQEPEQALENEGAGDAGITVPEADDAAAQGGYLDEGTYIFE
jgi:hypothetical protein